VASQRVVALDPEAAQERFWLARAYRLTGHPTETEREISKLMELAAPALH
jgi:hypothetical protein